MYPVFSSRYSAIIVSLIIALKFSIADLVILLRHKKIARPVKGFHIESAKVYLCRLNKTLILQRCKRQDYHPRSGGDGSALVC
jgi:hypothetical protein